MTDAIEASRRAFTAAARGEITSPLRTPLSRHRTLVMPAEHVSGSALVKVIDLQPDGWRHGLPSIGGTALWIDAATGRVSAMLDATALTALRTGAASGLATALLAGPGASVLAMLGTGGQAADQVGAVCAVRPIREVRVFGRHAGPAGATVRRAVRRAARRRLHAGRQRRRRGPRRGRDLHGDPVAGTAVRDRRPGRAGAHQRRRRLSAGHVRRPAAAFGRAAAVVIDQLEAVLAEGGDVIQAIAAGQLRQESLVEISQLLAVPPAPPRRDDHLQVGGHRRPGLA